MYRPMSRSRKYKIRFFHIYFLVLSVILALALTGILAQTVLARTYVISDGDQVVTYTTFAAEPDRILDRAGVRLTRFDTYTTGAESDVQTITVQRAKEITVYYHGQILKTATQDATAGELLKHLELEVTGEDTLSHDPDTAIFDGMELRVDRVVCGEEAYSASVPYNTIQIGDEAVPENASRVMTPGADGEKICTARVTYVNGEETERLVLSERITRPPTDRVVGVGTGEGAAACKDSGRLIIGEGYILLPTGEMLTYTRRDTVRATAYTHTDDGCDRLTATQTKVHRGTVAVDPRYIPYGTRMFIAASDGSFIYGLAVAEDCGGDIRGDRMDLYFPTQEECRAFGRRRCTIYFLG